MRPKCKDAHGMKKIGILCLGALPPYILNTSVSPTMQLFPLLFLSSTPAVLADSTPANPLHLRIQGVVFV